jgi:hypothetical protein
VKSASRTQSDRIRMLNDTFRSTFVGGRVVMTQGVDALPIDTKSCVLLAVQCFSNFTKDRRRSKQYRLAPKQACRLWHYLKDARENCF